MVLQKEALIFRIGNEWVALEKHCIDHICHVKKVHSLSWFKPQTLLGIVEIRGKPRLCVSLHALLGKEPLTQATKMVVCDKKIGPIVFPVDEVESIHETHHDMRNIEPALLMQAVSFIPRFQEKSTKIDVFQEELEHEVAKITQILFQNAKKPYADSDLLDIIRAAHSIKSACHLMGFSDTASLAANIEGYCTSFLGKHAVFTPEQFQHLVQLVDSIHTFHPPSPKKEQEMVKVNPAKLATLIAETQSSLTEARSLLKQCKEERYKRLSDYALALNNHLITLEKLYAAATTTHMVPLADGIIGLQRQVHEYAHALQKEIELTVVGETTPVDRDILEKLHVPLGHLVHNAIEHGIETKEERTKAHKPIAGAITLHATHRAGMLVISVTDDGRGMEKEGNGTGLSVVQQFVEGFGGFMRVQSEKGRGSTFKLFLPLTLSSIRALIVEIDEELYAFPLAQVEGVEQKKENVNWRGERIPCIMTNTLLHTTKKNQDSVVILSSRLGAFACTVDRIVGEETIAIHETALSIGKIEYVQAVSFQEDGMPIVVLDIDELVKKRV